MEQFIGLLMMAVVVEGMITYFKTIAVNGKVQWQIIASIALGVGVAVVYGLDMLVSLGFTASVPFIGNAITGIAISRGSNYVFDLVGELTTIKVQQ